MSFRRPNESFQTNSNHPRGFGTVSVVGDRQAALAAKRWRRRRPVHATPAGDGGDEDIVGGFGASALPAGAARHFATGRRFEYIVAATCQRRSKSRNMAGCYGENRTITAQRLSRGIVISANTVSSNIRPPSLPRVLRGIVGMILRQLFLIGS